MRARSAATFSGCSSARLFVSPRSSARLKSEGLGGLVDSLSFRPSGRLDEEFPIALADALELALGGVVEEFAARGGGVAGEVCGDVDAVDRAVGRERAAGEGGDGGEQVDGGGEFVAGGAGGDASRAPT